MQFVSRFKVLFFALLVSLCVSAQVNHAQLNKPDTLGVFERLSVSTNVVEWALLLPNLSLEYDLRNVTWNRWAIGLKVKGNWQTRHDIKPAMVYNMIEARAELRYYWRTRLIDNEHPRNKSFLKRLFSCRRDTLKHPNTTYYRGGYLSFSKYSFLLTGTGKQGYAASAGFLYGIVKPLYQFANGNALDLDMGISGGLFFMRYDKFKHDRESNCYYRVSSKGWHVLPYPMLNEVRLGLIYRFTRKPEHQLANRYRWRNDVDAAFRDSLVERVKEQQRIKHEKAVELKNLGDVQKHFDEIFNKVYPVVLKEEMEKKTQNDNELKRQEEEKRLQKEKVKEEERKKKEEERQKKEEEKLSKEKAKEEQKQKAAQEKAEKKTASEAKAEESPVSQPESQPESESQPQSQSESQPESQTPAEEKTEEKGGEQS